MLSVPSDTLDSLCKVVFQQRRKMLRASLASTFGKSAEGLLAELNIGDHLRPQQLEVADFCRLAEAVHRKKLAAPPSGGEM